MRNDEPSKVSARCVHAPPFSCDAPYALRSAAPTEASAAGRERFEFAYRPKTRPPERSLTAIACQSVLRALFGLTQASTVNVPTCNDALSATVTHEVEPSNANAPPYLPDDTHVVLVAVPLFPFPDASGTTVPLLSNEYAATSPGAAAVAPSIPADDSATIAAVPQRNVRRHDAIALPPLHVVYVGRGAHPVTRKPSSTGAGAVQPR